MSPLGGSWFVGAMQQAQLWSPVLSPLALPAQGHTGIASLWIESSKEEWPQVLPMLLLLGMSGTGAPLQSVFVPLVLLGSPDEDLSPAPARSLTWSKQVLVGLLTQTKLQTFPACQIRVWEQGTRKSFPHQMKNTC